MSNCADRVGLQPPRLVAPALHVARAAARTNLHRRDALPAGARLQAATLVMLSVAEWRSRPRVVGSHHTRCADAPAAAQRVAHDFRGGADRCVPRLRPEPPALVRAPARRRRRERARRLFSDHHRRVRLALAVLAICVTSRGVQNCARAAARKMRRREATNGAGRAAESRGCRLHGRRPRSPQRPPLGGQPGGAAGRKQARRRGVGPRLRASRGAKPGFTSKPRFRPES